MELEKVVRKMLGIFNGIVAGTIIGLGAYGFHVTGIISPSAMLSVASDVGGYAAGASTATPVTSKITKYPTGTVLAGAFGGLIGAGLALYAPDTLSIPVVSNFIQQIIVGLTAGGVAGILTRVFPGL